MMGSPDKPLVRMNCVHLIKHRPVCRRTGTPGRGGRSAAAAAAHSPPCTNQSID